MQYPVRTEFRAVGSFLACWILLLTLPGSVDAKPFDSLPSPAAIAEVLGIDIAHEKTTAVERDSSPNVIIILVDDMGYGSASAYGGDIPTPNLERLAREGARFTDGYSVSPLCSPARAGLLTGKQPTAIPHNVNLFQSHEYGLSLKEKTLADYFLELGYSTGMIGKWHLGFDVGYRPGERGFEQFLVFEGYCKGYKKSNLNPLHKLSELISYGRKGYFCDDAIATAASSFIFQHRDVPFFLYLSTHAPHWPWPSREESFFKKLSYYLMPGYLRSSDVWEKSYFKSVVQLDEAVGQVLDTIDLLGLSKNTLIWFLSDNGELLPGKNSSLRWLEGRGLKGYKSTLYENGIRVPFIARWTGAILPGVYEEPVQSLDILPTSLAAAGAASPLSETESPYVTGRNILPYLEDPSAPSDRYLFWKQHPMSVKEPHKIRPIESAVRFGDWKLITVKYRDQILNRELYNLRDDVQEKNNLLNRHSNIILNSAKKPGESYKSYNEQLLSVYDVFLDLNGRLDAATEFIHD